MSLTRRGLLSALGTVGLFSFLRPFAKLDPTPQLIPIYTAPVPPPLEAEPLTLEMVDRLVSMAKSLPCPIRPLLCADGRRYYYFTNYLGEQYIPMPGA